VQASRHARVGHTRLALHSAALHRLHRARCIVIQMRGKVQGNTTARGATQASWGRSRRSRQLSVVPFPDAGALGVPDGCWGRWNRAMEAHCVRCRCGAVRRARDATPWPPRRCYARAGAQRGTPPLGWCCSSAPRHVGCGCRCPGDTALTPVRRQHESSSRRALLAASAPTRVTCGAGQLHPPAATGAVRTASRHLRTGAMVTPLSTCAKCARICSCSPSSRIGSQKPQTGPCAEGNWSKGPR